MGWLIPRRWAHVLPDEQALLSATALDTAAGAGEAAVNRFEEAVARRVGVPHAICVNSGRIGMSAIFRHLGIGPGHEVIVPAYTLADLIPLIEALGARAVAADIDPATLNVTAASIAERLSARTRAVLLLHAFGAPAAAAAIAALTRQHGVPLIEDCAHALGAVGDGVPCGRTGYAAFYSFEPTKPLNTYGGGMVLTGDAALAEFIRAEEQGKPWNREGLIQKAAAVRKEQLLLGTGAGYPVLAALSFPALKQRIAAAYRQAQSVPSAAYRYSPAQAALGLRKLESLDARIAARGVAAAALRAQLDSRVQVQAAPPGDRSTWYFFLAVLPRPAREIRRALLWRGIDAAIEEEIADDIGALPGAPSCPNAAHVFRHAIALPMYDGLTPRAIARIARAVNASLG